MITPGRPPSRHAAPLLSALLAVALVLSGCSADEPEAAPGPPPARSSSSPVEAPSTTSGVEAAGLQTRSDVGTVVGKLPGKRRRVVRKQVTRLVDRWWEAAFLGGDYPRKAFPASFPGFTRGAERQARRDKALMTNLRLGPHVDSVRATRRRVVLDLLAVDRSVRTVTARFLLAFRTTGERKGLVEVRGRLFLARGRSGWRVFGYDVSKGVRA